MSDKKSVDSRQSEVGSQENMETALKPYSDNLPYDKNRIIEETKFLFGHEIAAKYEIGKRLILLRENEGVRTFAQILEESLSGLSRRRAYEYILFTQKITGLPKMMEFAQGGKSWSKALLLLETFDEDELKALEAGDPVAGITLDEVDKMSFRQVKNALRAEKDKTERGREQLSGLEEQNTALQQALVDAKAPPQLEDQDIFKELLRIRLSIGGLLLAFELVDITRSADVANEALGTMEFIRREVNVAVLELNQKLEDVAAKLKIEIDPVIGAEWDMWAGEGRGAHVRDLKHDPADHQPPMEIPSIEEAIKNAECRDPQPI